MFKLHDEFSIFTTATLFEMTKKHDILEAIALFVIFVTPPQWWGLFAL